MLVDFIEDILPLLSKVIRRHLPDAPGRQKVGLEPFRASEGGVRPDFLAQSHPYVSAEPSLRGSDGYKSGLKVADK